jgi:hypothetical protein
VSGVGDLNGDAFADVVVGAEAYDHGREDQGAAWIYYGSSGPLDTSATPLEPAQAMAHFGWSMASLGDVNGDGFGDFAVGSPYYRNIIFNETNVLEELRTGAAFIYHGRRA